MTGVEADTADVNLPGCRMEFMISTYANCPPYLHIHPICQRKERNACSAQANLKTVAFLCSSFVLILISATSSLAAIPTDGFASRR